MIVMTDKKKPSCNATAVPNRLATNPMIVPSELYSEYEIEHTVAVNAKAGKERSAPSKIPKRAKTITVNMQMHTHHRAANPAQRHGPYKQLIRRTPSRNSRTSAQTKDTAVVRASLVPQRPV
jgi:hypothetical protein